MPKRAKQSGNLGNQEEPKKRKQHALSPKAMKLKEGLEAGLRLTKERWSKKLYGDEDHTHMVRHMMNKLNEHGIPAVLEYDNPHSYPREKGYVVLGDKRKPTAEQYAGGIVPKDVVIRLKRYLQTVIIILPSQPSIAGPVKQLLSDSLISIMGADKQITVTQHGQLPSGKKEN